MIQPYQRLSKNELAIFLFHGVVSRSPYAVRNYTGKHMLKDVFYTMMKDLLKSGAPLSMDDVIHHHATGDQYPPNSFAITFDDGFENNYSIVAPILTDLNIPCTFYISTDFIQNNSMSWIDHIEYCLENTVSGKLHFHWDNGLEMSFSDPESKIAILKYLRGYVKQNSTINLTTLVDEVYSQCGINKIIGTNEPIDLKMTWKQAKDIHDQELFIIGGHSHDHVNLAFLNDNELVHQIDTSMGLLKEKAKIKADHYSYPEGLENCYSEKVISALKKQGVICCPTAIDGTNTPKADLFHLKRIMY